VAWIGVTWHRLAVDDPIGQFVSVTRWRGGYIARGNPRPVEDGQPWELHTQLWSSTDGRSWVPLAASALGASTIVVGMAATVDGLVALTFESGQPPEGADTGEMLKVAAPLRSWTSSDGSTWTYHRGPNVDRPPEDYVNPADIEWLQGSSDPEIVIAAGTRPPFVSTDGVTWTRPTASGLSAAFTPGSIKAVGAGFVAVSDAAVATSSDGLVWMTTSLPTGCSANEGLALGPAGSIATGLTDGNGNGVQPWVWCGSLDGGSWRRLPDLPPLGRMTGPAAQECEDNCPDGRLVGDGSRMLAYRGWGDQVGWTSFDGRSWKALTFDGHPETSKGWLDDGCTQSLVLWPTGVRCLASDGVFWFGEPRS
jgi:hypothetical protein